MTWAEAVRRDFRQCSGCWRWLPRATLTEHSFVYGSQAQTERVSRWFVCGICETTDAGSEPRNAG